MFFLKSGCYLKKEIGTDNQDKEEFDAN